MSKPDRYERRCEEYSGEQPVLRCSPYQKDQECYVPPVKQIGREAEDRLRGAAGLRSYLRSIQIVLSQPLQLIPALGLRLGHRL